MEAISPKHLMTSIVIILASSLTTHCGCAKRGSERPYKEANTLFIRTSCSSTTYPRLCYSSLVKHADLIQTNRVILTGTALNVTIESAKTTSAMMSKLAKRKGLKPREVAAMKDCVEELADTVDELRRSIAEMADLTPSNFEMRMSDVQTWVSAALTDESTCTDGFQEETTTSAANVKSTVRGQIVQGKYLIYRYFNLQSDLRASNFEKIMSDVQTWVSAALTDETTCNDGFQEITAATDIKSTVGRLVMQVTQLTSNALALINKLANSQLTSNSTTLLLSQNYSHLCYIHNMDYTVIVSI